MGIVALIVVFFVVAFVAKKLGLLLLLLALAGVVWFLVATQAWGVLTLLIIVAVLLTVSRLYVETRKSE